MEPYER